MSKTECLTSLLPQHIFSALDCTKNLFELAIEFGRPLEIIYVDNTIISNNITITSEDINYITNKLGVFNSSNRAGIPGTLHWVTRIFNKSYETIGLIFKFIRPNLVPLDDVNLDSLLYEKKIYKLKKENCIAGIYLFKSPHSDELYIGSSNNIRNRFRSHLQGLNNRNHHCKKLQELYNKAGNTLLFGIVEILIPVREVLERVEQNYLDQLWDSKCLLNTCKNACSPLGTKHTFQAKLKISEAHKGKISYQKEFPSFTGPDGTIHLSGIKITSFAKKNKVQLGTLNSLIQGTEKAIRGWSLTETNFKYPEITNGLTKVEVRNKVYTSLKHGIPIQSLYALLRGAIPKTTSGWYLLDTNEANND